MESVDVVDIDVKHALPETQIGKTHLLDIRHWYWSTPWRAWVSQESCAESCRASWPSWMLLRRSVSW